MNNSPMDTSTQPMPQTPPNQPLQPSPNRQRNIRLVTFALITVLVVLLIISAMVFFSNKNAATPAAVQNTLNQVVNNQTAKPSATPFLFEEMTIPYLRTKVYDGELGELRRYSDNSIYTTYLTSYTSDGLEINGLLTVPKMDNTTEIEATDDATENNRYPAIVFVHGYIPPTVYRTTERYIDHVNALAREGFVVFKIDLRGHGDSEGEPGGGYYSSDYIIDVLNAYSALQKSDFVDPQKIGLWGHSMAGNVALRAMAAKPEIPAASIWAGAVFTYTDMAQYGIQDSSYQPLPSDSERQKKRKLLRETYGEPNQNSWFWAQVIPTNYLNDLEGAIQLNHAQNDDVVNIGYSRNLISLLDLTAVPHEIKEYPSGGHNIEGSAFTSAMQNTVQFFNKYLKN